MAETAEAPGTATAAPAEGAGKEFTQPVKAGIPVAWQRPTDPASNGGVQQPPAESTAKGGEQQQQQQDPPADNTKAPDDKGGEKKPDAPAAPSVVDITDDQLKAHFEKLGIPFDNMEALKSKLTASAGEKELTPEEKAAVEKKKEDRMVAEHLAQKRSVEEYASLKQILAIDKKVLGLEKEINDLIKEGYTKQVAEERAKERYYQFTDKEIDEMEKQEDKDTAIQDRKLGDKKLEAKGSYLQKQAKDYFDSLAEKIADDDADALHKEQHTSKVEDALKKYERKLKFALGQQPDGKDIPPIDDFEVSDLAMNSTKEILKDFAGFKNKLLTAEGHVNLDFLLPHLIKSFSLDELANKVYLKAQDRTIERLKNTFGSKPPELGSSQNQNGIPGKLVKAGKPVPVTNGRPR